MPSRPPVADNTLEDAEILHECVWGVGRHHAAAAKLRDMNNGFADSQSANRRRLRPNVVIGGVEGLDERKWPDSGAGRIDYCRKMART
ncbi:MAG TPA: hypothetical protein VM578_08105 [Candidatus Saccharimonadales bacterium]|nr:hypothetical protein [Candidatus Saccharimonadales bacterium]